MAMVIKLPRRIANSDSQTEAISMMERLVDFLAIGWTLLNITSQNFSYSWKYAEYFSSW